MKFSFIKYDWALQKFFENFLKKIKFNKKVAHKLKFFPR